MRFLTADYLYPLNTAPIRRGVLQVDNNGKVISLYSSRDKISADRLEIFNGIICPGFINTHCHLELSHLHKKIEKSKGLVDFIKSIINKRNDSNIKKTLSIENAEKQMIRNGIVAVGDVCNTTDTISQKKKHRLQYYNFIEGFAIKSSNIDSKLQELLRIRDNFRSHGLKATIVPHSSYSVIPDLMQKILENSDNRDNAICIHNQESKTEIELFLAKKGRLYNWLNKMSAEEKIWDSKNSSMQIFKKFKKKKLIFVHNTFSSKKDITGNYYCTCPKANLHIESSLPDYSIFDTDKLCLGTDSLASNNSLSILDELLIIQENTNFTFEKLLKIASLNGALALGFNHLGSFQKGNKPGVNLIQNLVDLKITNTTKVIPLL